MQQGSTIAPRALSTRCVSGVWLVLDTATHKHECIPMLFSAFKSIQVYTHCSCFVHITPSQNTFQLSSESLKFQSRFLWQVSRLDSDSICAFGKVCMSCLCLPLQPKRHFLSSKSSIVTFIHFHPPIYPFTLSSTENPAVSSPRCAVILILPDNLSSYTSLPIYIPLYT